ncbi:MAG: hypothetical protein Q9174_003987 [Haloplaca sp. 1 TL-2023]
MPNGGKGLRRRVSGKDGCGYMHVNGQPSSINGQSSKGSSQLAAGVLQYTLTDETDTDLPESCKGTVDSGIKPAPAPARAGYMRSDAVPRRIGITSSHPILVERK